MLWNSRICNHFISSPLETDALSIWVFVLKRTKCRGGVLFIWVNIFLHPHNPTFFRYFYTGTNILTFFLLKNPSPPTPGLKVKGSASSLTLFCWGNCHYDQDKYKLWLINNKFQHKFLFWHFFAFMHKKIQANFQVKQNKFDFILNCDI